MHKDLCFWCARLFPDGIVAVSSKTIPIFGAIAISTFTIVVAFKANASES